MELLSNPLINFNYDDSKALNNAKKASSEINISKLKNDLKAKKDGKFRQVLDSMKELNNDFGGKFVGKDKDLAPRNATEKKLLETAMELESILVNTMYKSMRGTLNKEDDMLYGGMTEDIFSDMLYNEYSLMTSKNSNLGLAKQIYTSYLEQIRNTVSLDEIV